MEGCTNFRDAGGYPTARGGKVRTGLLYRSASPARMTERDVALARDELGIKTVVDLRAEAEALEGGSAPFTETCGVDIVAVPMGRGVKGGTEGLPDLTTASALGPLYVFHAEQAPERIVDAVSLVASRCQDPLVVHCAGGKDRTGMVIALVLDVLGVDHEMIVEDYALTERSLARIPKEHLAALAVQMGEHGWPEAILHAVPDSMRTFLKWLTDEHGSAEGFLASQGSRADTVDALRSKLLA
ncbi:MAG TPA: tyrosine-protein phosphatase [Acidimicrobiales bacterium]|nr:tyrosine-protein phosphatase [Acidimicrobiales bacterium]